MSKSKHQQDTFRKIKRVPSDTKDNRKRINDESYDVAFSRVPSHIQIPNFRYGS